MKTKKILALALVLVIALAMTAPAAAGNGCGPLYSVADSWYFDSVEDGELTVSDNKSEYVFSVENGVNFLGLQREFIGQLKFVGFDPVEPEKNFRHIVIWDFKQGLSENEKGEFFSSMKEDLENLVGVIPGIVELRVMRDIVNAGINGQGQIVLEAAFETQAAYEVYRFHPAHLEIAGYVVNNVENRRGVNFLEAAPTGHSDKFRHIVVWEFQDVLSEEDIATLFSKMKEDLEGLVGVIDGLVEMNVFRDHYNLIGNGQVVLVALFDSRADWENYVPHPEHQRIAGYVVSDIVIAQSRRGGNFYELG